MKSECFLTEVWPKNRFNRFSIFWPTRNLILRWKPLKNNSFRQKPAKSQHLPCSNVPPISTTIPSGPVSWCLYNGTCICACNTADNSTSQTWGHPQAEIEADLIPPFGMFLAPWKDRTRAISQYPKLHDITSYYMIYRYTHRCHPNFSPNKNTDFWIPFRNLRWSRPVQPGAFRGHEKTSVSWTIWIKIAKEKQTCNTVLHLHIYRQKYCICLLWIVSVVSVDLAHSLIQRFWCILRFI